MFIAGPHFLGNGVKKYPVKNELVVLSSNSFGCEEGKGNVIMRTIRNMPAFSVGTKKTPSFSKRNKSHLDPPTGSIDGRQENDFDAHYGQHYFTNSWNVNRKVFIDISRVLILVLIGLLLAIAAIASCTIINKKKNCI